MTSDSVTSQIAKTKQALDLQAALLAAVQSQQTIDADEVAAITRSVIADLIAEDRKAISELAPHAQPAKFAPSPSYTRTATCDRIDLAIAAARASGKRLIIVSGPSGSSKTFAARHALGRLGLEQYTVECSGATTTEDLIARPWTNGEGRLIWVEQALTRAARFGGVVLLDEFDLVDARVLGRLHSILDCDPRLRLPSGEEIVAHPDFLVIACCNGLRRDTGGSYSVQSISTALLGRAVFVKSDYLSRKDEVALYTAQGHDAQVADRVYTVLLALRELFKQGKLAIAPSPRLGLAVLGALTVKPDEVEAWEVALLAGCDEKTAALCRSVISAAQTQANSKA